MKSIVIRTVLIGSLAAPGTAWAEQQPKAMEGNAAQSASSKAERTQVGDTATDETGTSAAGKIQGLRTIRLQGERDPHVLAQVELSDGRMRVLDLGPASNLQKQNRRFKKGQPIQATGQQGRINEVAVLVVDRIEGDGVVTVIPLTSAASQPRREAAGASASKRIAGGHVVDLRTAQIGETGQIHRLAKIDQGGGQTIVVDLGPKGAVDLEIEKGDPILAQGSVGRLNGKPALFARQVAEVASVQRPQSAASAAGTPNASAPPPQGTGAGKQNAASGNR